MKPLTAPSTHDSCAYLLRLLPNVSTDVASALVKRIIKSTALMCSTNESFPSTSEQLKILFLAKLGENCSDLLPLLLAPLERILFFVMQNCEMFFCSPQLHSLHFVEQFLIICTHYESLRKHVAETIIGIFKKSAHMELPARVAVISAVVKVLGVYPLLDLAVHPSVRYVSAVLLSHTRLVFA
jgi:hypothetical protein